MRIRPLKPSFFKNELICSCSPWARLLLQGLWMMADANGRLECRPQKIKAEVFPYDDSAACDIAGNMKALAEKGLVNVYEVNGDTYLEIPKFKKHARPHPKEATDDIPPPPKSRETPCNFPAKCVVSGSLSLVSGSLVSGEEPNGSSPPDRPQSAPSDDAEPEPGKRPNPPARAEPADFLNHVPASLAVSERFMAAWADFVQHRRQMKQPLTERAAAGALRRLDRFGLERAVAAVEFSVANGWRGIFEEDERGGSSRKPGPGVGSARVAMPDGKLDLYRAKTRRVGGAPAPPGAEAGSGPEPAA